MAFVTKTYLYNFRTFVRFALVWFCLFPLPLGVRVGLRFVIVALPELFSNILFSLFGVNSSIYLNRRVFVMFPGCFNIHLFKQEV